MNRQFILTLCAAVGFGFATAQTKDGGLSADMLKDIVKEQKQAPVSPALVNAVAANAIDDLAKNHSNAGQFDTYFSIETPSQSITDEKSSGRCWMFSGFNVLRSVYTQQRDSIQLEFSQAYLFFYDQLEKANLMLQGVIDTGQKPMDDQRVQFFFHYPLSDGGTFCGVADLVDKYGLVPKEVMPESFSSDNTSKARSLIASKLREFGLQLRDMVQKGKSQASISKAKVRMLAQVYRMLEMTIGQPPQKFTYAFKTKSGRSVGKAREYTPLSFSREVVGGPLNGTFIMVMNDPRRPYYKTYEVEWDRHTYDGHNWRYLNLPMDEIEKLAIASLRDGRKLYSSYDVGKFLDRKRGYADTENFDYGSLFGTSFGMDKAQRIATFDSGSTHAMTLCAVDLDAKGNATKWKVENSWGADWGQKGCLIMSDRWFREFMFRLVVDKKYVSENLLKAANQEPVMVMPEDPLFLPDESDYEEGDNTIQPRIGITMSSLTNMDDSKMKVNLTYGVEFEHFFTDQFSVAGGIIFTDQGTKFKSDLGDYSLNLYYSTFPLTANYYVLPGLAVKAGLQPAIRVKARMEMDGTKIDLDRMLDIFLDDDDYKMNKFDLSIPFGLSYEYSGVTLDARYNLGVTKLFSGLDESVRNNVIVVTLGYKL